MAAKGSLDDMFEGNLEKWKQSSSFMDALKQRALNLPSFVWPAAKTIRKDVRDEVEETEKEDRLTNSTRTLQEALSSSLQSSGKDKYYKNARHHGAKTAGTLKESKKSQNYKKKKHKRCAPSSELSMSVRGSSNASRDSLLSNLTRLQSKRSTKRRW